MKKRKLYTTVGLFVFALGCILACNGQSTATDNAIEPQKEVLVENDAAIDALLHRYAQYGSFNGTVLVAQEGNIVYQQGFGFADMEWDIPNQPNTKFRIGSITKQFTAMLVVQLVADGQLDLHVPISTYLPDYPKENGEQITLHHLLTHSSGTPNNYESTKPKAFRPDSYSAQVLVDEFSALPLEFTPGERFEYSNSGYTLLGHIVETVSNKSYEELLQERIFTPLNMNSTGFDKHRAIQKNRAKGYFRSYDIFYNANYVDMSTVYAAGALYSTVEDLLLWDQALYTEQLLPKAYMDLIFTAHIPDPGYGGDYGYGWSLKDKEIGTSGETVPTSTHDGVIDGFCAIITRIPSSNTTIILLSNSRRGPLNYMTKGIMGILYKKPYRTPRKSAAYSFLEVIDKEGMPKGVEHYKGIKDDETYYLEEEEMNIVSYKLLLSDRPEEAAEVLELAIADFPEAFNLYDSYGEVLRGLGRTEEAIANYTKSVQLNPENVNGLRMLEEMGVDISKTK